MSISDGVWWKSFGSFWKYSAKNEEIDDCALHAVAAIRAMITVDYGYHYEEDGDGDTSLVSQAPRTENQVLLCCFCERDLELDGS